MATVYWAQHGVAARGRAAAGATFAINSNGGAVTPGTGGLRLTTGAYLTTVTVTCTISACSSNKVNVKIQAAGTLTGRAKALTTFNVTMGTASLNTGTTSGSAPISFTLNSLGLNIGKTFFVGAAFPIAGTGTAGDAKSPFTVAVATYNSTPSGGTPGNMEANVYPGITIGGTSPMQFGGVAKSAGGSGTISMDATGAVTVTGTGLAQMPATSFPRSAAAFTVVGEPSAALSITVPTTFTMTSPASGSTALTVTTVKSVTTSPPPALDASGSYSFTVGGSIPIASTTVIGAYTGSISVTATYN
jgi:hypothetical protein